MVARPFVKMAGGKTQLLPEILPRLPKNIGTYFEPFVGGGAVFFALAAEGRFETAVIGDMNIDLITAYRVISSYSSLHTLFNALLFCKNTEEYFYMMRKLKPSGSIERAARFIYLNKTCFNGLYRVNKSGQFNTPFGHYDNPKILDRDNLHAAHEALQGKFISQCDFSQTVDRAMKNDVVYFDPPYYPVSRTANFAAYTNEWHHDNDLSRLVMVFKMLANKGVKVLLSNADLPNVRELFKDFKIESVMAKRNINSAGHKRGKVGEILVSANL